MCESPRIALQRQAAIAAVAPAIEFWLTGFNGRRQSASGPPLSGRVSKFLPPAFAKRCSTDRNISYGSSRGDP